MDWARHLEDRAWAEALAGSDERAPALPTAEIQEKFVGSSGVAAFEEVAAFWKHLQRVLGESGAPISGDTLVLDIGVGWGRLYRWMLRDVPASHIVGVDVDPQAVKICQNSIPLGDFRCIPPRADYPADKGQFDIAVAYSVFSHLSEATAISVLAKARKVLKPGSLLALTTMRADHIDVWASRRNDPYWIAYLDMCSFNRLEWWMLATEGEHLYVPTGGGFRTLQPDSYGEAVVPMGWWKNVEGYRLIAFERPEDLPQAFVVLERL